jgi:predicted nucleic-acid-binding Zn-ribbon protein
VVGMKTTGACPKCKHNRLLHVKQIADRVGDSGGAYVDPSDDDQVDRGNFYPWRIARLRALTPVFLGTRVHAAGLVEAFICRRCGLTELYTTEPDAIEPDGEVVVEVTGPEAAGPYR